MAWDDEVENVHRDLAPFDFRIVETDKAPKEDLERAAVRIERLPANRHSRIAASCDTSQPSARTPAGFALGESRVMDLLRLPAGEPGCICIALVPWRGLFAQLEYLIFLAVEMPPHSRRLTCGRMAHPASARWLTRLPTVVPKPGLRPTPWQQEVGQAIADAYGNQTFDPQTFVCSASHQLSDLSSSGATSKGSAVSATATPLPWPGRRTPAGGEHHRARPARPATARPRSARQAIPAAGLSSLPSGESG
jgi:hypothetical protein